MIYVAVISQVWLMQRRRASPPGGARSEARVAAAKNSKIDLCPPNFNAIQISASLDCCCSSIAYSAKGRNFQKQTSLSFRKILICAYTISQSP
jgi:hypothetical protein